MENLGGLSSYSSSIVCIWAVWASLALSWSQDFALWWSSNQLFACSPWRETEQDQRTETYQAQMFSADLFTVAGKRVPDALILFFHLYGTDTYRWYRWRYTDSLTLICRQSANNIVVAGHEYWFILYIANTKILESKRQAHLESFWTNLAAMVDRTAATDSIATFSDCSKMILHQEIPYQEGSEWVMSSRNPVWNRSFFKQDFSYKWHNNQEQTAKLLRLSLKEKWELAASFQAVCQV